MGSHIWKLGIGIVGLVGVALFAATAEVGEEDSCREACQSTHIACVSTCSAHSNPIECESRCNEERDDCNEGCGD